MVDWQILKCPRCVGACVLGTTEMVNNKQVHSRETCPLCKGKGYVKLDPNYFEEWRPKVD